MKKLTLYAIFFIVISFQRMIAYINFDTSMGLLSPTDETELKKKLSGYDYFPHFYELIKDHYQRVNLDTIPVEKHYQIPPIIHHIWLGSRLPKRYQEWREGWVRYHPNWIFILWTDHPANSKNGIIINTIEELKKSIQSNHFRGKTLVFNIKNYKLKNQKLFNSAKNYGERSDILRLEVINLLGGLYIDTDFECIQSFDILHKSCQFYSGLVPLDSASLLPNGIIGSKPCHAILRETIDVLHSLKEKNGIFTFPTSLIGIIDRGPRLLGKSIYNFLQLHVRSPQIILLPASYFFPINSTTAQQYKRNIDHNTAKKYLKEETFAIHHWCASWTFPTGNVRK